MLEYNFKCNLCSKKLAYPTMDTTKRPIGIVWTRTGRINLYSNDPRHTETHICSACLSGLQALPKICIAGFECDGGPNCTRDHK